MSNRQHTSEIMSQTFFTAWTIRTTGSRTVVHYLPETHFQCFRNKMTKNSSKGRGFAIKGDSASSVTPLTYSICIRHPSAKEFDETASTVRTRRTVCIQAFKSQCLHFSLETRFCGSDGNFQKQISNMCQWAVIIGKGGLSFTLVSWDAYGCTQPTLTRRF